jgi:hypothetical protein
VLLDAVDAGVGRHAIPPAAARVRVVAGTLGPDAAILGVATALMSRELEALVSSMAVG